MVAAAEKRGLPLVELHRATPFVPITEAVHALIIDAQLAELRATEEIHQRFTELSVEGAEPAEVVSQAAALAGAPVVLENLARQVLAYDAAGDRPDLLLDDWESWSRRIQPSRRPRYDAHPRWPVTAAGAPPPGSGALPGPLAARVGRPGGGGMGGVRGPRRRGRRVARVRGGGTPARRRCPGGRGRVRGRLAPGGASFAAGGPPGRPRRPPGPPPLRCRDRVP